MPATCSAPAAARVSPLPATPAAVLAVAANEAKAWPSIVARPPISAASSRLKPMAASPVAVESSAPTFTTASVLPSTLVDVALLVRSATASTEAASPVFSSEFAESPRLPVAVISESLRSRPITPST